jgi:NADH dehydrogenase FAD-containing subunit
VLPGFPRAAERRVLTILSRLAIDVQVTARASAVGPEGLVVDGELQEVDGVVLATGVVPSPIFADSGMPVGDDGALAVNENLHMLGDHSVFGGGDCIWFTPRRLPRAGVFAVREGPILVHNVTETLERGRKARLKALSPQSSYLLLLNLGDDTALFWRRVLGVHVVFRNAGAFRLKDRIDFTFMRKFGSEADRKGEDTA